MDLTFAALLTPEGAIAFAAVVTGLVALLKYTFPPLDSAVSGALMAFAFTLIGYVLCAFSIGVGTLDQALLVFVSWLGCATSAVGIHSTAQHMTKPPGIAD